MDQLPLGNAPGVFQSIIAILKASWLKVLLIFIMISLSWISHWVGASNTLIFVSSSLALAPLAKLLADATDELSLRFGKNLAGLLTVTMENGLGMIEVVIALSQCKLTVVKSTLIGLILSNLLLVLGICFVAGGSRFSEQGFGISIAQTNSSLLTLSVIAVLLPAAFRIAVHSAGGDSLFTNGQDGHDILRISHGVAIILLFVYLCYIVFQLFSHKNLYDDNSSDVLQSVQYPSDVAGRLHISERRIPPTSTSPLLTHGVISSAQRDARSLEAGSVEEEETEKPRMCLPVVLAGHVILAGVICFTSKVLVGSIDDLTSSGHISEKFVGLILLPIPVNAAKIVTVVNASLRNKTTLSVEIAVGSSIQIALFVIPFTVILGWILGKPLTLLFDPFESIVLFFSLLTVNYVMQDGKSNWLEGMILICLYVIVAIMIWYYPGSDSAGLLEICK